MYPHAPRKYKAIDSYCFRSRLSMEHFGLEARTSCPLLMVSSSFISIFFMNMVGRWMDRFGIERMMYLDALTIFIYVLYGFVVLGVHPNCCRGRLARDYRVRAVCDGPAAHANRRCQVRFYLNPLPYQGRDHHHLSTGIRLDHVVSILAAEHLAHLDGFRPAMGSGRVLFPGQPVCRLADPGVIRGQWAGDSGPRVNMIEQSGNKRKENHALDKRNCGTVCQPAGRPVPVRAGPCS